MITTKDLLKIIAKAAKDGRTTLDLSNNQLTALPAEIAQLTNLTTLYLSYNQLTALPAEIAQLTNLTWLQYYSVKERRKYVRLSATRTKIKE